MNRKKSFLKLRYHTNKTDTIVDAIQNLSEDTIVLIDVSFVRIVDICVAFKKAREKVPNCEYDLINSGYFDIISSRCGLQQLLTKILCEDVDDDIICAMGKEVYYNHSSVYGFDYPEEFISIYEGFIKSLVDSKTSVAEDTVIDDLKDRIYFLKDYLEFCSEFGRGKNENN